MAPDAAPLSDSQAQAQLQALREEVEALKSQVSEPDLKAFEQIKELRATQRRLSDDVKRLTGEGVQLAFKNRQYDQQVKKLQAELEAAVNRGRELEGELEQTRGELQTTQGELSDTREQLKQTQEQLGETRGELDSSQARGRELEHSIEELREQLGEAENRGQKLDLSIEELRGELGQSRDTVLSHEGELARQKEQLAERQAHLASLQQELGQREGRISKLEQLVTDFKEQFLSGDFEAVAAVPSNEGTYGAIAHHVELALGMSGRELVDQVYDLLELDRKKEHPERLEELFDTLGDTGSQLFSEPSEQAALKKALAAAWSATQGGPIPSSAVGTAAADATLSREHEAPAEPFPPVTSADVLPTGAADAAPVVFDLEPEAPAEPAAEAEPEAEAEADPVVEAESQPEATEPEEDGDLDLELELDLGELDEIPLELDSAQAGAPEDEPPAVASGDAAPEPAPVAEDEPSELELSFAEDEQAALAEPNSDLDLHSNSNSELEADSESEPAEPMDWAPPRGAAKSTLIAEALALAATDPAAAQPRLTAALESELEVGSEGEAHLALARAGQGKVDIVPHLTAAMSQVEVPDLFALLSAAQANADDEVAERLDLFEQFGSTPRGEMTRSEGSLGLGKRPLNRDFVNGLGSEHEKEVVDFLRDELIANADVDLPVPSSEFEERLESTGPSAFVGTLRQALRSVDYSLFGFPDLKVRTYDGDELFVVEASAEPELTLMFHRDIEGMPPEELTFLALRHVIRMYRGHSQLAHQAQALTADSRLALIRTAVELYLKENSAPHPSLVSRLDALDANSASFAADAQLLLRHWYEASEWEPFLWTSEYLFDDQVFARRLDPMADHAAARLTGVTAATYGLLREELLETPDMLEALNDGLADLFSHMPESAGARMRVQRLWSEFLQEEEA